MDERIEQLRSMDNPYAQRLANILERYETLPEVRIRVSFPGWHEFRYVEGYIRDNLSFDMCYDIVHKNWAKGAWLYSLQPKSEEWVKVLGLYVRCLERKYKLDSRSKIEMMLKATK